MGQEGTRDQFPAERFGRLEARVDGHDQEFLLVRAMITELTVEQRKSREDAHLQQEITREKLGEKVDNVAAETAQAATEVAILREVATNTRNDLRGMKRLVTGGIGSLIVAILLERLIG